MFTRERHRRGTVYFGPYANAKKVRETLDVLNRVFQFRPCEGPEAGAALGDPVPRLPHRAVHGAVHRGDLGAGLRRDHRRRDRVPLRRDPSDPRERSSSGCARRPPRSGSRRRPGTATGSTRSRASRSARRPTSARSGTIDVIGLAVDGDRAAVQLFPLRDGKLVDRFAFHLENVAGQDRATILESFCVEHYGGAPAIPPQIVVPADIGDTEALAAFLGDLRGARVEVRSPQRGEKRRLAELAEENARLALEHDASAAEQQRRRRVEALEQLRESLNLESLPGADRVLRRLEHPGPRDRRVDGRVRRRPAPDARTTAPSPSAGSRGRTTSRRWRRSSRGASRACATRRRPTASTRASRPIPNLVVIDGGKGQLSAALEAIHATFDLPRVAVVALAKREEEVFVPGRRRRSGSSATTRACSFSSVLGTRRTASRSATTGGGATRARSSRSSTTSRGSGRRGGARSCATSARPSRSSQRRRRSSRAFRGCPAKTARAVYAQLHKAGRA